MSTSVVIGQSLSSACLDNCGVAISYWNRLSEPRTLPSHEENDDHKGARAIGSRIEVWSVAPGWLATSLGGNTDVLKQEGARSPSIGGKVLRGVIDGRRDAGSGKAVCEYRTPIQLYCVAGGFMTITAWEIISTGDLAYHCIGS